MDRGHPEHTYENLDPATWSAFHRRRRRPARRHAAPRCRAPACGQLDYAPEQRAGCQRGSCRARHSCARPFVIRCFPDAEFRLTRPVN